MTAAPSGSSRRRLGSMRINNRNFMKRVSYLVVCLFSLSVNGQDVPDAPKVYPTNWWVGMHYSKPELTIHLKDVGNAASVTVGYPGVTVADWHRVENPNYL